MFIHEIQRPQVMPVGEIKTHKIYIKAMTTPYLGSYLGYMFVRSKTKPSLLIDEGGKKSCLSNQSVGVMNAKLFA